MNTYLTYAEYTALGGTVSESVFPNLERKAQAKLDYYTHNRIKSLTTVPDEVKEVLTEYVNAFNQIDSVKGVASYSNGTESFSYETKTTTEIEIDLYRIAVEYLPVELISQVVV